MPKLIDLVTEALTIYQGTGTTTEKMLRDLIPKIASLSDESNESNITGVLIEIANGKDKYNRWILNQLIRCSQASHVATGSLSADKIEVVDPKDVPRVAHFATHVENFLLKVELKKIQEISRYQTLVSKLEPFQYALKKQAKELRENIKLLENIQSQCLVMTSLGPEGLAGTIRPEVVQENLLVAKARFLTEDNKLKERGQLLKNIQRRIEQISKEYNKIKQGLSLQDIKERQASPCPELVEQIMKYNQICSNILKLDKEVVDLLAEAQSNVLKVYHCQQTVNSSLQEMQEQGLELYDRLLRQVKSSTPIDINSPSISGRASLGNSDDKKSNRRSDSSPAVPRVAEIMYLDNGIDDDLSATLVLQPAQVVPPPQQAAAAASDVPKHIHRESYGNQGRAGGIMDRYMQEQQMLMQQRQQMLMQQRQQILQQPAAASDVLPKHFHRESNGNQRRGELPMQRHQSPQSLHFFQDSQLSSAHHNPYHRSIGSASSIGSPTQSPVDMGRSVSSLGSPMQSPGAGSSVLSLGSPMQSPGVGSSVSSLGSPMQSPGVGSSVSSLGSPMQSPGVGSSVSSLGSPMQSPGVGSSVSSLGSPIRSSLSESPPSNLVSLLSSLDTERSAGDNYSQANSGQPRKMKQN
jgi:hypothetical protein